MKVLLLSLCKRCILFAVAVNLNWQGCFGFSFATIVTGDVMNKNSKVRPFCILSQRYVSLDPEDCLETSESSQGDTIDKDENDLEDKRRISNTLIADDDMLLSQLLEGFDQRDEDDLDNNNRLNNDEPGESELSWKARRTKWKSKRYMMLKDVGALIKSKSPNAIEKARQVVECILEFDDGSQYGGDNKPLLQAYNLWLQAISKTCTDTDKGRQAEDVLRKMNDHVRPTTISYTICITAYTNSPQNAERLLFELLERQQTVDSSLVITSSITTDAVLHAWAQQGTREAADRARLILERLEQWSMSSQNAIEANSHTYSIVMNAFSQLGAVDEVEAMLAKRIQDDIRLGEHMVDTVLYNVAIKAWAVSQDARAGTRATKLLAQMEEQGLVPDIITYNSVLSAWSKCGHVNAAAQAERILQDMITRANANISIPRPNTVSYNTVLHAWSKSQQPNAVQRASNILEYMIRSQDPKPDIYSFTSVLNVVAKSKEPDKAVMSRKLLDTLIQLSDQGLLQVSNIAYNIALNTCAFSASFDDATRMRALQIAVSTFAQLRSSATCSPDDISYGNILKAIANLLSKNQSKRQQLGLTVMRQCMEDGMVGDMVWQQLPRCLSQDAMTKLLPNALQNKPNIELVDVPRKWRRNVKVQARRQSKKRKVEDAPPQRIAKPAFRKPRSLTEASWASGKDL